MIFVITYNSLTFLTASKVETLFLSKETRLLRRIIFETAFFGIINFYAVMVLENIVLIKTFESLLVWFAVIAILSFSLLSVYYHKSILNYFFIKWIFAENHLDKTAKFISNKWFILFLFMFTAVFILFVFFIFYGDFVKNSLNDYALNAQTTNQIDRIKSIYYNPSIFKQFILSIVFLYLLSRILITPGLKIFTNIVVREIKVNIKLSNGEIYKRMYLHHPTFGKRILIGEEPNFSDSNKHIAIQTDKIVSIEFQQEYKLLWSDNFRENSNEKNRFFPPKSKFKKRKVSVENKNRNITSI